MNEIGVIKSVSQAKPDAPYGIKTGDTVIAIDERYFRPSEVELLLGNPDKAKTKLSWQPHTDINQLAQIMTDHDYELADNEFRLSNK